MATINASGFTLLDHMKRLDPDGKIAPVVDLMTQENMLLQDMVWREGNLPTGHRVTQQTSLPAPTYRMYNQGVADAKGQTAQFDEACAMLSTRSKLDVDLAELNGNTAEFRAQTEMEYLAGLNNEVENGMFYNSTLTAPEKFMGLAPRFASTSATGGSQIVLADSASDGSDNTSVWLVGWSPRTVFGIFPKGSKAGITADDLGKQLVSDGTNSYRAYVTDWTWKCGLVVQDYRYVARVANIDTGRTTSTAATSNLIIPAMIRAWHKVRKNGSVKWVWYVNRTVGTYLHLQALNSTTNSTLAIREIGGMPITTFLGAPVRETDGILNTETTIS